MADEWIDVPASNHEDGGWIDVPARQSAPANPKEYTIANPDPSYIYPSNPLIPARGKPDGHGGVTPEFAWPGIVRGILSIGEKASGQAPIDPTATTLSGNETAALGLGAGSGILRAPAQAAADLAVLPDTSVAGMTRGQATSIARQLGTEIKAAETVERRANQDIKAGYTTAQDVVDRMIKDRENGKPVVLSDSDLPNVLGLTGNVARKPGTAQALVKGSADARDAAAPSRLQSDVARDITGGASAYRTGNELAAGQQRDAQPLYDKAFAGGSLAPLERQFQDAFNAASKAEVNAGSDLAAAQSKLTAARAKQSQASNVYSTSAANQEVREAEIAVTVAQRAQAQATAMKQQVLEKLRASQDDIANKTPGAVWSPRIQEALNNPDVRRGLPRGIQIQRNEAFYENRPFDPTEYALSPEGDVIKVPNMRLLDAAKKGLDAIIESEGRDEYGRMTQYGRSVNQVRIALLEEMDRLNPDYLAARSAWSGPAASMDALKFGRNILKLNPEEIADRFAELSESDQEFVRIGLADTVLERVGKTGYGGDEAKAIAKNEWTKKQIKPIFRSESDFTRFVDSVDTERRIFERDRKALAGSQTAERAEESGSDNLGVAANAAHGLWATFMGHPVTATRSLLRMYRDLGLRPDPELNEAIARIVRDPSFLPGVEAGRLTVPTPVIPPPGAAP